MVWVLVALRKKPITWFCTYFLGAPFIKENNVTSLQTVCMVILQLRSIKWMTLNDSHTLFEATFKGASSVACFEPWTCPFTDSTHRIHGTGICTYILLIFMVDVDVGKYTIHGSSTNWFIHSKFCWKISGTRFPAHDSKNTTGRDQLGSTTNVVMFPGLFLVGGPNPSQKYARPIGFIFPKEVEVKIQKNLWVATTSRWFKVTFWSPSWRSLNPLKRSLNHPKKVPLNHQASFCSSTILWIPPFVSQTTLTSNTSKVISSGPSRKKTSPGFSKLSPGNVRFGWMNMLHLRSGPFKEIYGSSKHKAVTVIHKKIR